jgi:hypothetical protein
LLRELGTRASGGKTTLDHIAANESRNLAALIDFLQIQSNITSENKKEKRY